MQHHLKKFDYNQQTRLSTASSKKEHL